MIALTLALTALAALQSQDAAEGSKSRPEEVKALHALGRCVAEREPAGAAKVLAMDFREAGYGRALDRVINNDLECPQARSSLGRVRSFGMTGGGLLWAGAIAEGLMSRNKMIGDLGGRTAYRAELPAIEARNAGELMAFCVVRKDPAAVAAWLQTIPATPEEGAAIRAASPTLSGCVPANSKSAFTRESLRALMALGAYRLAAHNGMAN